MIKTGEYQTKRSRCDFCRGPSTKVNGYGMAICAKCEKEQQMEKQAGALDWKGKK